MLKSKQWFAGMVFFSAVGISTGIAAEGMTSESLSPWVSERGEISLPEDFRNSMAHLGSWYVPEGGAAGFHDVYVQSEAVESYRKNGIFPDGAVLIKELRSAEGADYTTGKNVQRATDKILQTFVMVKDSQNRFEQSSQWGDGWGWALFKPGDDANVSTDYMKDCLGCHTPAKDTDWVYVEGYPTLR